MLPSRCKALAALPRRCLLRKNMVEMNVAFPRMPATYAGYLPNYFTSVSNKLHIIQ